MATERSSDTPVEVQGLTSATQVAAGNDVSCALLTGGHVECWGWNGWGQLGDGSFESSDVPVQVKHLTTAVQVTAGEYHTCAVLASGHVDCWGYNGDGELGSGRPWSEVPTEVLGVSLAEPPGVETGAAEEVTAETAVLHGTVDPEGEEVTSCTFEYGQTTSYGSSVPCSPTPGSSKVKVTASLSGLTTNAIYHFRITATTGAGTTVGTRPHLHPAADQLDE